MKREAYYFNFKLLPVPAAVTVSSWLRAFHHGWLSYYSSIIIFKKNRNVEKRTERTVHGKRKLLTPKANRNHPPAASPYDSTNRSQIVHLLSHSFHNIRYENYTSSNKTTMKSIISSKHRILITVFALLSLISLTESKLRLVPRGKNTKKQQLRKTKQTGKNIKKNKPTDKKNKKKQQQVILKPKRKEAPNLQLQATLGTNEKGEQVLLLSQDSAAVVSNAMQSTATQDGKKKQQVAEVAKQAVLEEEAVEEEEEPEEQQVLFYDPAELKTAAGEIPLPKRVFDADGNEVDMAGKEAILVRPPKDDADHPPPLPPLEKDQEVSPFISI